MTPAILPFAQPAPPNEWQRLIAHAAASTDFRVRLLRQLLGEGSCRQLGIYPIPAGFKLSVVVPVYNERQWVAEVVRRVQAVPIPKELILVDDGSTDGTRDILRQIQADQ